MLEFFLFFFITIGIVAAINRICKEGSYDDYD